MKLEAFGRLSIQVFAFPKTDFLTAIALAASPSPCRNFMSRFVAVDAIKTRSWQPTRGPVCSSLHGGLRTLPPLPSSLLISLRMRFMEIPTSLVKLSLLAQPSRQILYGILASFADARRGTGRLIAAQGIETKGCEARQTAAGTRIRTFSHGQWRRWDRLYKFRQPLCRGCTSHEAVVEAAECHEAVEDHFFQPVECH